MKTLYTLSAFAIAAFTIGCGPRIPKVSKAPLPEVPSELARCKVSASHERPLVTEWPASEKANLESQLQRGGVVVSYSGCKMRVLSQCVAQGSYRWTRTTPATDYIEIKNEDELYAKLPLGAASLSGELESAGQLSMETTVAGQHRLDLGGATPRLVGTCEGATHVLDGLAVGAFDLRTGGSSKASVAAEVTIGSAGASRATEAQRIRQAGNAETCANATVEAPDPSCASPIQMFLIPAIAGTAAQGPGATSRSRRGRSMPGDGLVDIEIVAEDPEVSWNVFVDNEKVCTSPCTQRMNAKGALHLKEDSGLFSRSSKIVVGDLGNWEDFGGLRVEAETASAFTLSGLVRVGGIFYGAIGVGFAIPCLVSDDRDGLGEVSCGVAGMTLGIGTLMFAAGTWLMNTEGEAKMMPK